MSALGAKTCLAVFCGALIILTVLAGTAPDAQAQGCCEISGPSTSMQTICTAPIFETDCLSNDGEFFPNAVCLAELGMCDPSGPGDAACGNGILEAGEECDDGNTDSNDGCSAACREEFCDDGIVQRKAAEECDDGNRVGDDGCSAECLRETVVLCHKGRIILVSPAALKAHMAHGDKLEGWTDEPKLFSPPATDGPATCALGS